MHKDDQMTPKERMAAFGKGEPIDRIPTLPFTSLIGARIAGMSLREMRQKPENEAIAQIAAYRRLGHDGLTVDYGLHNVGVSLGSRLSDPPNGVPAVVSFALEDLSQVDHLDMSQTTFTKDAELRARCASAEYMLRELGDECGVDVTLSGPFTAASSLFSPERLLKSLIRDPAGVHKLLRFCTDALKGICTEFAKRELSFTICDPVASGTMIRARHYREFVYDYTKELVDHIHSLHTEVGYHICGDSSPILVDMVETGVDLLSLDNIVDMCYAKETVGDKICIVGNVDPVGVLMMGTTHDVESAVLACMHKSQDSPKGFVLATGCDIPYETPIENVDYFMEIARKYG